VTSSLKNRIELAKYFAELGFTEGAEVGVFTGYFSEVMFQNIPALHLYCVDIWGEGKYQRAEEACLERLKPYNATIIKNYSVEAAKQVPDGSLDFVYIDGAHDYTNVKADIEAWAPKVKVGGIISGDDFYQGKSGGMGVMKAVTEYCNNLYTNGMPREYHYNLKLTLWDDNNPIRDDRQPNWYFVKDQ